MPKSSRMPETVAAPAAAKPARKAPAERPVATLALSSKNYSSWSLRGWLMARFAGIEFTEVMVSPDNLDARRELLLLTPSIRVPRLTHDGANVWNTLAIAQYLDEIEPNAGLMPENRIARAHCRSISGEMNSGFANLRSSLPMNLKADFPGHEVWAGAQPDIDRIVEIWTECLATYGGPYLFGTQRGMADAMYAPVVTRFLTYHVGHASAGSRSAGRFIPVPPGARFRRLVARAPGAALPFTPWGAAARPPARRRNRQAFLRAPEPCRARLAAAAYDGVGHPALKRRFPSA